MKVKYFITSLAILLCAGLLSSAYAASPGRFITVSTSGEMFLDYSFNPSENDNEFEVGRVYVNLKSTLSDQVAARFTTDVDPKIIGEEGYGIRVKYAYADLKNMVPMTKITFGLQGNLWTGMADNAWGYRVVSKSLLDQYKVIPSADIGLGATVSIPEGYGEIVLQVLNGGGYKQLETNKAKALAGRVLLIPMPQDDMLKGLGVAGLVYIDEDDAGDSKLRLGGMAKFKYQIVNVVGEFGVSQDGAAKTKGMGFAGAAEVKAPVAEGPIENLALIARIDRWDEDTSKSADETSRVIGGVSYEITKGVKAIGTLQHVDKKGSSEQEIVVQAHVKF